MSSVMCGQESLPSGFILDMYWFSRLQYPDLFSVGSISRGLIFRTPFPSSEEITEGTDSVWIRLLARLIEPWSKTPSGFSDVGGQFGRC